MGAGETNIGYGRFDHVRVPRFNMLNKNDKVTETGTNPTAPPAAWTRTLRPCPADPCPLPFRLSNSRSIRISPASFRLSVCVWPECGYTLRR